MKFGGWAYITADLTEEQIGEAAKEFATESIRPLIEKNIRYMVEPSFDGERRLSWTIDLEEAKK